MNNRSLFCMSFIALTCFASAAMAGEPHDQSNTANVNELETIIFGAPTNKAELSLKGKSSQGTDCTISIKANPFGIQLVVGNVGDSLTPEFILSKSAKVSELSTADKERNVIRESQINNTETERGDNIVQENLTLSHNEKPGQDGNIISVSISDNTSPTGDYKNPAFNPATEVSRDCSVSQ